VKKTHSWFYLGPVAITVLVLSMLLWVVPALSGASLLSAGTVSTNLTVVSPDSVNIASGSRQVTVTLTNTALDVTDTVKVGGNIEPPTVSVPTLLAGDSFRIFLSTLTSADVTGISVVLPGTVVSADVLPIVDSAGNAPTTAAITISGETGFTAGQITVSELISAASGSIRFVTSEAIATGSSFRINFFTSPQEAALVNVKGDGVGTALPDNMDLVLNENVATAGTYSGSFQISDSVVIDMGTGLGGVNTITHEQHNIPQGLQGNRLFSAESHAVTAAVATGSAYVVTVTNPPINLGTLTPTVNTTGVTYVSIASADAGTINVVTNSTTTLSTSDSVSVTYRGADSFTFTTKFAPIQTAGAIASSMVIPSNRDTVASSGDYFQVMSVTAATGVVKVAVIKGTGSAATTLPTWLSVLAVSYSGSETVTVPGTVAAGGTFTATLNFPPKDANASGTITGADVKVIVGVSTGGTIDAADVATSVNGNDVVFTNKSGSNSISTGDTFTVAYAYQAGSDPQNALLPVSVPRPIIYVAAGSRATVTSSNSTATVDAETDAPVYSNPSPASASSSNNVAQSISLDISDPDSGVNTTSIVFYFSDDSDTFADSAATRFDSGDLITTVTAGGVTTATVSLATVDTFLASNFDVSATGVTSVRWWVKSSDKSGNSSTTDANATTTGSQPYTLSVDKAAPTLTGAWTGEHWSTATNTGGQIEGDRRTGVGTYLPGAASPTSIRVQFSEALDGTTVAASDFTVDGVAPTAANWYTASGANVYLTVPAMNANAKPAVVLAGAVADAAGNALNTGTATATDGIAPISTVTLNNTRSTGGVEITVSVDEAIRTLEPDVDLWVSDVDAAATAVASASGVVVPKSTKLTDTSWKYTLTGLNAGRYSIVVTSEDDARNRGTAGQTKWQTAGSVSIEVDKVLPAPVDATGDLTTNPLNAGSASTADPFFVEINWLTEADEYVGDTDKTLTLSKAVLDAGKAGETDVLALSSSRNGQNFSIAITGISLGAHTLTFNGKDTLGNTLAADKVLSFTVVAVPSFTLNLVPGMNLISVPGRPTDTSIKAVFGAHADVDLVYTYDPKNAAGPWLVAERSGDTFEGSLTTIDSSHAYWVRAKATVAVTVAVPPQGSSEVLPSIEVTGGQWNLVPVISLLANDVIPQGTELDVDSYLGAGWTVAFTFDRGVWQRIIPAQNPDANSATLTDAVQTGRGYWVYYTANGRLTP